MEATARPRVKICCLASREEARLAVQAGAAALGLVYLAGGLRPENVGDAIRQVGPFGVDLCGGVRTDGRLDALKLARFFAAVDAAR
jgi:phosphoribosylanthranilate isomerase